MTAKKKLRKAINLILNDEIEIADTFSVFEKCLTAEECENELMCARSVDSIEFYERIKQIERQYLRFVLELKEQFSIFLVYHSDQPKIVYLVDDKPTFNSVFREVTDHVNQEKRKFIFIKELNTIILLSFDFTFLLYKFGAFNIEPLNELFLKNGFHQLN